MVSTNSAGSCMRLTSSHWAQLGACAARRAVGLAPLEESDRLPHEVNEVASRRDRCQMTDRKGYVSGASCSTLLGSGSPSRLLAR